MEEFLKVLWMAVVVLDFHPFEVLKDINTIYSNRCEFLTFHSVWWLWAILSFCCCCWKKKLCNIYRLHLYQLPQSSSDPPHLDPSTLGLISLLRSIHSVCRRPAGAPNWSETGHWTELGRIVFTNNYLDLTSLFLARLLPTNPTRVICSDQWLVESGRYGEWGLTPLSIKYVSTRCEIINHKFISSLIMHRQLLGLCVNWQLILICR